MLLTEYIICPFLLYKNVEPVGKNGKKVCCMMTEEAKRLIRSLLKALHIFHQHGVCPGQFDESNIVLLKDGKLKFRDITFEAKDETGVLRNYQNVHLILSQLLPDNVPEDIKHLLDLMSSSRSSQMGYMIYTHTLLWYLLETGFNSFFKCMRNSSLCWVELSIKTSWMLCHMVTGTKYWKTTISLTIHSMAAEPHTISMGDLLSF